MCGCSSDPLLSVDASIERKCYVSLICLGGVENNAKILSVGIFCFSDAHCFTASSLH